MIASDGAVSYQDAVTMSMRDRKAMLHALSEIHRRNNEAAKGEE